MKKILVTGGLGYIGSHICIELINEGYEIVIIDNLDNSNESVLKSIEDITSKKIRFYKDDIRNKEALRKIFLENEIYSVIHLAGLKSINESVKMPLKYYDNNIYGTIVLTDIMNEFGIKNIIFSSSATVYGKPKTVPIKEDFSLSVTNPYGRSKLFLEDFFVDLYNSDNEWNIVILRYFNPIGAHKSGKIGEKPNGIPNNLVPYVTQVAISRQEHDFIFAQPFLGIGRLVPLQPLARPDAENADKMLDGYLDNVLLISANNALADIHGVPKNSLLMQPLARLFPERSAGVQVLKELFVTRKSSFADYDEETGELRRLTLFKAVFNNADHMVRIFLASSLQPQGFQEEHGNHPRSALSFI